MSPTPPFGRNEGPSRGTPSLTRPGTSEATFRLPMEGRPPRSRLGLEQQRSTVSLFRPPGTPPLTHPGTSEAMFQLAPQKTRPVTIGTVPATWPKPPPRGCRSTWYLTHPPTQGPAKRCPGWRFEEPWPPRSGLISNPTDLSAGTKHSHLVPHPSPVQGRAKRCSGWRSREPAPSRSGLSPQRSPRPSSDRAPHEERAGGGGGGGPGTEARASPGTAVGTPNAGGLARRGG